MYAVVKMKFMEKAELLHMDATIEGARHYIDVVKPEGDIRIFRDIMIMDLKNCV